jgi:hypothetical protein
MKGMGDAGSRNEWGGDVGLDLWRGGKRVEGSTLLNNQLLAELNRSLVQVQIYCNITKLFSLR